MYKWENAQMNRNLYRNLNLYSTSTKKKKLLSISMYAIWIMLDGIVCYFAKYICNISCNYLCTCAYFLFICIYYSVFL